MVDDPSARLLPQLGASHVAHFVLLPLLVLLERFAYYAVRAGLLVFLVNDLNLKNSEAYELYGVMSMALLVAPLLGGVGAAALGPYAMMVLGGGVCVFATWGLAGSDSTTVWLALGLLVVGQGLLRPAVWTIASAQLPERHHARTALLTGLYVMVNLGAAAGAFSLAAELGPDTLRVVFGLAGWINLLVVLLTVPLWVLGHQQRWAEPSFSEWLPAAGVALGTAVLASPYWFAIAVGSASTYAALASMGTQVASVQWLNPAVVVVGGVLVFGFWVGMQVLEVRWPGLILVGVALVASSLGTLLAHSFAVGTLGAGGVVGAMVGMSLAEIVLVPAVMAQFGASMHWRLLPLWFALWSVASGLAGMVGDPLVAGFGTDSAVLAGTFVLGVAGVAVLAGALGFRHVIVPPTGRS